MIGGTSNGAGNAQKQEAAATDLQKGYEYVTHDLHLTVAIALVKDSIVKQDSIIATFKNTTP